MGATSDNQGWVKLHRKMLSNAFLMASSRRMALWIVLLLKATHEPHKSRFAGEEILLLPGQLVTGSLVLEQETDIPNQTIRRILEEFEREGMIEQRADNRSRLISIRNWATHQVRAADEQQNEQRNEQQGNAVSSLNQAQGSSTGYGNEQRNEQQHFRKVSTYKKTRNKYNPLPLSSTGCAQDVLYHGTDKCWVEGGAVTIMHDGQRLSWGGGYDDFRFNDLRGKEALDAAKQKYRGQ